METYGCQMNKAESESILRDLASAGWVPCPSEDTADLVIINTCSVRETAEERIRGRLDHYRQLKKRRDFTLVITGCMAERLRERLIDEHPEVDVVVGNFSKKDLRAAVASSRTEGTSVVAARDGEYSFASLHSTGGSKAFVPIMHGCDNWCTYCIVPTVRGREVSRSPQEILSEIRVLEARGVREATLLGQNVNSYRWQDAGGTLHFAGLLKLIEKELGSLRWLRFISSHPKDLSEEVVRVMVESAVLCRHIHLPLQSGSTRVLGLMNRGYTAESYRDLVRDIRRALTGVAITTDILIGFPGETEQDFQDTLRLMREIKFDDAFTYRYNPREGTVAYSLPEPVPDEVKQRRLSEVIDEQRRIGGERARERIGRVIDVLVEGVSKRNEAELLARTEWDAMVVFPGPQSWIGDFRRVRLDALAGTTYRGCVAPDHESPLHQLRSAGVFEG
jgi:tRNA-2-methylthio-N6-dimethylallyladenosine synthase